MEGSGDEKREGPPSDKTFTDLQEKVEVNSDDQKAEGPPPTDPSHPDYVCPCHINVEICDQCMTAIDMESLDTTTIIEQIRKDQNKKRPNETTPKKLKVEGGQLDAEETTPQNKKLKVEGGELDSKETTPETPKNSAVLVSVTRIDKTKFKYQFEYRATMTAAEDPATPSTSNTPKSAECPKERKEVILKENNKDEEKHEENEIYESDNEDRPILDFDFDEEEFDGRK